MVAAQDKGVPREKTPNDVMANSIDLFAMMGMKKINLFDEPKAVDVSEPDAGKGDVIVSLLIKPDASGNRVSLEIVVAR